MAFFTVTCSKDSQNQLATVVGDVFKNNISKEDLLNELKVKVTPQVFVPK